MKRRAKQVFYNEDEPSDFFILNLIFSMMEDNNEAINQSSELTGSVGAGGYVELSLCRLGLCFDRSISTGCRSSLPATQERERRKEMKYSHLGGRVNKGSWGWHW